MYELLVASERGEKQEESLTDVRKQGFEYFSIGRK